MIPLMPSLAKGDRSFRASDQTVGVDARPIQSSGSTVVQGSMGPPAPSGSSATAVQGSTDPPTPFESHDSGDEQQPPPSSPPHAPPSQSAAPSSVISSLTSSQKRKHVALDSVSQSFQSSSGSEKKQRGSGVAVLSGIKDSIDQFNTTIRTGMPIAHARAADRAAAYRVQAMDQVQKTEAGLDDDRVIALVDLFRTDSSAAEAYMAFVRPGLRAKWLSKQLKALGFPDDIEGDGG